MLQKLQLGLFKAFRGLSQPVFLAECPQRTQEKAAAHEPFPAHASAPTPAAHVPLLILMLGMRGSPPQGNPQQTPSGAARHRGDSPLAIAILCNAALANHGTKGHTPHLHSGKAVSSPNKHKEEQLGKTKHGGSLLYFLKQLQSFPRITQ